MIQQYKLITVEVVVKNPNGPMHFTKMHGLGNDFIVIDATTTEIKLSNSQIKWLCDRHLGIGADQLLLIEPSTNPQADFNYRIFNQDGKEAEHCGNGARCVTRYIYLQHKLAKPAIILNTHGHLTKGWLSGSQVSVAIAIPQFTPKDIPYTGTYNSENVYEVEVAGEIIKFGIVSVGNPHAIINVSKQQALADDKYLANIAEALQRSEYFPNGVNVNFYWQQEPQTIYLRTFERGCGFTLACGTGASATVAYGILKNYFASTVRVLMPGGELNLEWHGVDMPVIMQGDAVEVFTGVIKLCS